MGVGQNTPSNIVINITDIAWSMRQYDNDDDDELIKSNDFGNMNMEPQPKPLNTNPGSGAGGVGGATAAGGDEAGITETMRNDDPFKSIISMPGDLLMADDSLIAAAGSNGVVVIWRTCDILGGGFGNNYNRPYNRGGMNMFGGGPNKNKNTPNQTLDHFQFLQQYMNNQIGGGLGGIGGNRNAPSATIGQPEAILVEHNRAVNRIAWHRNRPGIFLTASQDTTVKMFERREDKIEDDLDKLHGGSESSKWSWFSKSRSSSSSVKSFSWHYTGCFKPNCGSIKDIQWSHCNDDLFAMVTNNGFLVVHNIKLMNNCRPMIQIAAHAREATTLDWHPIEPYIIATGSGDRTVKG